MKKIIVDILLLILMLIQFSKVYLTSEVHEIIGISLILLAIIHIILNRKYIKAIPNGKYNSKRKILLITNAGFLIVFSLTCILGLLSSQSVLTFLNISNLTTNYLHKIFAYLSIILLGIHLGTNLTGLLKRIEKKLSNKFLITTIYSLLIICGIYSFIHLDFYNHLIGNSGFSIVTGSLTLNILEYLTIIAMTTILANLVYRKL